MSLVEHFVIVVFVCLLFICLNTILWWRLAELLTLTTEKEITGI